MIKVVNGDLQTNIFTKPTDKHLYLHSRSDHPSTTKKAIPYGLGVRARRICSNEQAYQEERQAIKKRLVKRGYRESDIEKSLKAVDTKDRKTLLQYRTNKKVNDRVPLVLTYHRNLPNIQHIVHNRLSVLHRSERMRNLFKEAPITAYRRDSNLMDIIVHNKHTKIFRSKIKKCAKCAICPYITDQDTHTFQGISYTFNKINCKSMNIVYGIKCLKCDELLYVGETGNKIYERFQNHLSSIRNNNSNPIAEHFNSDKHNIKDIEIVGLEKIKKNDIHLRKIRESFWIKKMGTLHPKGLNQNSGVGDGIRSSSS